jgi:hypothetical protein
MLRLALIALCLAIPGAALAGQPTDATDFDGVYDIEPVDVVVSIHLGLAILGPEGGGAWGDSLNVPLDPDGIDAAEADALQDELFTLCEPTILPKQWCEDASILLVDAVVDFNNTVVGVLPETVEFVTGSWGWVSKVFGLYPAVGTHYASNGDEYDLGYLLDNNAGVNHGNIASAALAINGFTGGQGWACVDVSGGLLLGNIDHSSGFDTKASFIADRELFCAAAGGGYGIAGTIGLAWAANLEGSR